MRNAISPMGHAVEPSLCGAVLDLERMSVDSDLGSLSKTSLSVKRTKASFAGCPISDRKLFHQSRCILPISIIGHKEHEGERFSATLTLVNSSFKACTLLIVDSLYKYTLQIEHFDKDDVLLHQMAIDAGDSWFTRNASAYQKLTIPHNVIRWDTYRNHPNFKNWMKIVSNLYDSDVEYQSIVNHNAEQYLTRYLNRATGKTLDDNQALIACVDYLKEECAGMCLWAEDGYQFEVYPTGRCPAMKITYERLIKPLYPEFLKPVAIRFKKH